LPEVAVNGQFLLENPIYF